MKKLNLFVRLFTLTLVVLVACLSVPTSAVTVYPYPWPNTYTAPPAQALSNEAVDDAWYVSAWIYGSFGGGSNLPLNAEESGPGIHYIWIRGWGSETLDLYGEDPGPSAWLTGFYLTLTVIEPNSTVFYNRGSAWTDAGYVYEVSTDTYDLALYSEGVVDGYYDYDSPSFTHGQGGIGEPIRAYYAGTGQQWLEEYPFD